MTRFVVRSETDMRLALMQPRVFVVPFRRRLSLRLSRLWDAVWAQPGTRRIP